MSAGQRHGADRMWVAAGVILLVVVWECVVRLFSVNPIMLAAPSAVAREIAQNPVFFMSESVTTLLHVVAGLVVALGAAIVVGSLMALSRRLESLAQPILVIIMVTPWVAYITSVVLFVGRGRPTIVFLIALVTLPPFAYALVGGLRSVEPDTLSVFRSVGASRLTILRVLRIPSAIPSMVTALRFNLGLGLGAAYFAEGASVNSAAYRGLGEAGKRAAAGGANGELLWATIACTAFIGIVAQFVISKIEHSTLRWHPSRRSST